ncbi:31043_t:CDS:2, partial [Racocetra persica]
NIPYRNWDYPTLFKNPFKDYSNEITIWDEKYPDHDRHIQYLEEGYDLDAKVNSDTEVIDAEVIDTESYLTKISDENNIYKSDIILAKQAEGTVGFFVTNSTYSINAYNEASNSKQQIILCTKNNVIEKIKATKLNLENKELQKNSFKLNDLVIKDLKIDSGESTIYLFGIKIDGKYRIGSMQIKDNFKIKKHITELEILLKKLIDNINDKEYSLKQEYLSE